MQIQLHDKFFEPYITSLQVKQAIEQVVNSIVLEYKDKKPLLLPVLDGAFMFAADIAKQLPIEAQFSFIKYKSYHNTQSTGKVSQVLGLDVDIEGKDVLIVEDIVDTGLTVSFLLNELQKYRPASIQIATLLLKPTALQVPLHIKHKGIEIPNYFVVGYGMDYNGLGRNLPEIYKLSL